MGYMKTIKQTTKKPEVKDWGFVFSFETEIEALRHAYLYRNSVYGSEIKIAADGKTYLLTIFSDLAKSMGIDTGK